MVRNIYVYCKINNVIFGLVLESFLDEMTQNSAGGEGGVGGVIFG